MVKCKVGTSGESNRSAKTNWGWIVPAFALVTFLASWADLYPTLAVEQWYARSIFPLISGIARRIADAVRFSWLDLVIPVGFVSTAWLILRRQWKWLLNLAAAFYLILFWSWALNYHRERLSSKLQVDVSHMNAGAIDDFTMRAAAELNRLYKEKEELTYDEAGTLEEARRRVRRVIGIIDGKDWDAPHRVKVSWIANRWFRAAGIDGMFNPIGHEPIVSETLLDIERPFVVAHEFAHVQGYPDEGDANVIAALATLMSSNPAFQYSGWLNLWLYLRNRDRDRLLDSGPREDLQRIFSRLRRERIEWISHLQSLVLDWFLKANSVEQGIRSYSRVVLLVAGIEPSWERFR